MAIALSHGGSNMYSSPAPSREIFVGTRQGVARLQRHSQSQWKLSRVSLPDSYISAILFEPQSNMLFAGAFFGSIHASLDGGRTWERRANGLAFEDVYSLAAAHEGGGVRLYAGTEPAHLFGSDDLGLHWSELPSLRSVPSVSQWTFPAPPHVAHTKFITVDPHNPATIYACIEQGALLKSTDSGRSWCELNQVGLLADKNRPVEHFYDIHKAVVDPRNSRKLYVSGGAGLYVTEDGGEHWRRQGAPGWAPDVYPDGLVLNPRHPEVMFVSAAEHNPARWRDAGSPGYSGSRIYRSTDSGRTWDVVLGGLPVPMQAEIGALCLEDWGESFSIFAATSAGQVYASDDGGDHWNLICAGLAPVAKKGHERLLAIA